MQEPNLNYIDEISDGDDKFKRDFISLLKKELPVEIKTFRENFNHQKYKEASANVHKLKHKIAILGIPESHKLASEFELNLKKNNKTLYTDFDAIIEKILIFVQNS